MTRRTAAAILATGITLAPTAALADEPTFQVTLTPPGIQLLNGDVFEDNGHLNVHTTTGTYNFHFEGKCVTRTDAECAGQRHEVAQYIGEDWFPLGEFIPNLGTVCWVQKSGHNFHYTAPCGTPSPTPSATPTPEPTATPEPSPTPTVTPTPEPTATPTPEPTPEPTQTPTPSDTPTPLPTATGTPTPTGTSTPTATEGVGPTPQYTERPEVGARRLAESGGESGYGLALIGAVLIAAGLGLYQRNRRKA